MPARAILALFRYYYFDVFYADVFAAIDAFLLVAAAADFFFHY